MADTKLTAALVRAMCAVRSGKVYHQRFNARGNTFDGPPGVAPSCYRRLEAARFIEDDPTWPKVSLLYRQRLTKAGVAALEAAAQIGD